MSGSSGWVPSRSKTREDLITSSFLLAKLSETTWALSSVLVHLTAWLVSESWAWVANEAEGPAEREVDRLVRKARSAACKRALCLCIA